MRSLLAVLALAAVLGLLDGTDARAADASGKPNPCNHGGSWAVGAPIKQPTGQPRRRCIVDSAGFGSAQAAGAQPASAGSSGVHPQSMVTVTDPSADPDKDSVLIGSADGPPAPSPDSPVLRSQSGAPPPPTSDVPASAPPH